MNYFIKINNITTIEEIEGAWTKKDYVNLLEKFDYPNASSINENELRDYLFLAISDFEPHEAAEILLEYKLSDKLNENQIATIALEMTQDKVAEEYPVIELHLDLFNINQLLFKAYNGTFPNTKASVLEIEITSKDSDKTVEISKEIVLKALVNGLSDSCLINRLFNEQLKQENPFTEAEGILWHLIPQNKNDFKIITSEYWIGKEDVVNTEFETEVLLASEEIE